MSTGGKVAIGVGAAVVVVLVILGAVGIVTRNSGSHHYALSGEGLSLTVPGGWSTGPFSSPSPFSLSNGVTGVDTLWEARGHESGVAIGSVPAGSSASLGPTRLAAIRRVFDSVYETSSVTPTTLDGREAAALEVTASEDGHQIHARGLYVLDTTRHRILVVVAYGIQNSENDKTEQKVIDSFHLTD